MGITNGHLSAFFAFSIWALAPIYWQFLREFPVVELTFHRLLWGGLILWPISLIIYKQKFSFKSLFRFPLSAFFIVANWAIFVYAMTNGHIIEASLGYFINPILNVFFGWYFFKEKISKTQGLSLAIGIFGTLFLFQDSLSAPWICLLLPLTFGLYGVIHKKLSDESPNSLRYEILWGVLFYYIFMMTTQNDLVFTFSTLKLSKQLILVGVGPLTIMPLLFFSNAVKRIDFSVVGIWQYLAPVGQFLLGILYFKEEFSTSKVIGCGLIIIGAMIFLLNSIKWNSNGK